MTFARTSGSLHLLGLIQYAKGLQHTFGLAFAAQGEVSWASYNVADDHLQPPAKLQAMTESSFRGEKAIWISKKRSIMQKALQQTPGGFASQEL